MTKRQGTSTWRLLTGVVIAEAGILIVGFGELSAIEWWMRPLSYFGGFLVLVGTMCLCWKDRFLAMTGNGEAGPGQRRAMAVERFLGKINLNGRFLEAYEEEVGSGSKQFRLRASPPIGAKEEAAYIRYLIREGFIDEKWRRVSKRIKEEACWAFLL